MPTPDEVEITPEESEGPVFLVPAEPEEEWPVMPSPDELAEAAELARADATQALTNLGLTEDQARVIITGTTQGES